MISYAQNFEDVILERVFEGKRTGNYIDIGAHDPEHLSVTKHFYDKGWSGINVEPVPQYFDKLQDKRKRDINLKMAVHEIETEMDFYSIPDSGISTFVEKYAEESIGMINDEGKRIDKYDIIKVKTIRLENIFRNYLDNKQVDFLKIDVEGAERTVLRSNDWARFRPKVIIVESNKPNCRIQTHHDWENILMQYEYTFVYYDGLNRFYLRHDMAHLVHHFAYPPCVFDNFIRYHEHYLKSQLIRANMEIKRLSSKISEIEGEDYEQSTESRIYSGGL